MPKIHPSFRRIRYYTMVLHRSPFPRFERNAPGAGALTRSLAHR